METNRKQKRKQKKTTENKKEKKLKKNKKIILTIFVQCCIIQLIKLNKGFLMLVRKITFKNGRVIYKKTSLLEKISFYENYIYPVIFTITLILALILRG